MDEKREKLLKLAGDVLILSRNTLLVNLRFLDMALSALELIPAEGTTVMTDGTYLFYDPAYVLRSYRAERARPIRDYLHMIFHCVYRHMFTVQYYDRELWDLACDIAVENVISELGIRSVSAEREKEQTPVIGKLKNEMKFLTAEKIYDRLTDKNLPKSTLEKYAELFRADSHEVWYMSTAESEARFVPKDKQKSQGNQASGSGDGEDSDEEGDGSPSSAEIERKWRDISERMQTDLESFSREQGRNAGSMMQNLNAVNREKYDYAAFLKKFAVTGEVMKINDDEFDYIFYTYGMKLYDRMPLIEPLEYKDVKRIREFVIAIDTSGSTSGELVQTFLQKTYNILKSTESFFTKINLYIIQCDAEVQEAVHITSQEDFDNYLKTMKIRGLGGTDFRPVFSYVNGLIAEKRFSNLKGLVYFTDGYGNFPEKKPDYQTAFVFIDDEYNNPDVPPWAIKLVLQKNEI